MKGVIIINAYPNGEKFLRQGERIAEELHALGVEADVLKNGEATATVDERGQARARLPKPYNFVVYLDKDKYLGRMLEKSGYRLFNSAQAVESCDDKMLTYLALSGGGVRLAKSVAAPLCYTPNAKADEIFLRFVAEELGFPLVAKKSYGSFGAGVQLVHGMPELKKIAQEWLYVPHFYQQYIAASAGKDVRVIVIGGKAVAAMERVAQKGEFRSNIELGGEGRKIDLSEAYRKAAEQAAQTLGLDYCGVDLLETDEGPLVCEVNSNAFFEGLEKTTGYNVAKAYACHILQSL
ncbi:MAG: RimK family alpha-L-glutamate ligase [Clostridia bacterium]|nr:RimK family alpha-L-glutamate ligase [Clostridia bacterium]